MIRERLKAIFANEEAVFTLFEGEVSKEAEHGGLTQASTPWQIAAAWRVLGEVFVQEQGREQC